jgi:PAS domain-containing protein
MAQPIELILARHLATSLTIPTFLVDIEGTLVFYNEAAEPLLGRRFDEAGEMAFEDWTSVYAVRDGSGRLVRSDENPLVRALRESLPEGLVSVVSQDDYYFPKQQQAVDVNGFFAAVVDATEEAVLNTLWAAEDTDGRDGRVIRALPHEPVLELLRDAGRLGD